MVYSAVKVDAEGAEWVANAAGFHHSDQHGFGLMDAYRLTVTAAVWALLPVMVVTHVEGGGAAEMPPLGRSLILSVIGEGVCMCEPGLHLVTTIIVQDNLLQK